MGMTLITEGVTTATNPNAFGTVYNWNNITNSTQVFMGAVLQLDNVTIGNEMLRVYSPGYGAGAFDNRGGLLAINGHTSTWGTGTTSITFATSGAAGYTLPGFQGATAGSTLDLNATVTWSGVIPYKVGTGTEILSGGVSNVGDQNFYVNAGHLGPEQVEQHAGRAGQRGDQRPGRGRRHRRPPTPTA